MPRRTSNPIPPDVASQRIRRKYHVGVPGWTYVFITVFVALGAFNSQNNLLFWAFGFSLALLIVSGVLSGWMLMGIRIQREFVPPRQTGEPLGIRYRVWNVNRLTPAYALTIVETDHLDPPPPSWQERFFAAPGARSSPLVQGLVAFVASVKAGQSVIVTSGGIALRRSPLHLRTIRVETSFPFGLISKSLSIDQPAQSVIVPTPLTPPHTKDIIGAVHHGEGASARRQGFGDDFFSLRDYQPGDNPRQIAWRASARKGGLLIRQQAALTPRQICIVLHLRSSQGSTENDEQAIRFAAGLAVSCEAAGISYSLIDPLTRTHIPARRGEAHLQRVMRELGLLDLGPDDGRGERTAFPVRLVPPRTHAVVLHSGPPIQAFAPSSVRVTHIGTDALIDRTQQPPLDVSTRRVQTAGGAA